MTTPVDASDRGGSRQPASPERAQDVLIKFRHGLGDAVQLTVVLKHLRHYHPAWNVDVAALCGKHSAFGGLCRKVYVLDQDRINGTPYERVLDLDWHECRTAYQGHPSTKACRCLQEVFGLKPVPSLCTYTIRCGKRARQLTHEYLEQVCGTPADSEERFPAAIIHYQGNTSRDRKDLPEDVVEATCQVILEAGAVPVILDWDHRSPLVDGVQVHNPGPDHPLWNSSGTGDAEVLAALIQASRLMIGVDSGPLHVAGSTTTPTVAVWTQHHPAHFFDLADHVLHLVPENHARFLERPAAGEYFQEHYRHRVYQSLYAELPAVAESLLTGEELDKLIKRRLVGLRSRSFGRRYYEEHKLEGLNFLTFGQWQKEYGRWVVESLGLRKKRVLDVGCACGALTRGLGEAGAIVEGIDVSEYMIQLGRRQWPDMARLLSVCDAVNLHLYGDASWDAVHCSQVAEHWKPELVPHILRELHRVVRPGGLLFCALDTQELVDRQERDMETEDPTHLCVRPVRWWHQQLAESEWEVCSSEFEQPMRECPGSFLKRYDWDWFVARKP
jgi:2-polyprenyl-3-methyl-5-hydroxy-6-metoxy-1,4-benzoquinol methylase